ncbi:MAG: hypothetical protein ACJ72W_17775 [Actinoallomurus sp.]
MSTTWTWSRICPVRRPRAVLRLIRDVLDALVGRPVPQDWDDAHCIRVGTGRTALTAADRKSLGPVADLFPIFG